MWTKDNKHEERLTESKLVNGTKVTVRKVSYELKKMKRRKSKIDIKGCFIMKYSSVCYLSFKLNLYIG